MARVLLGLTFAVLVRAFNNPPGVDIWCGKAYRATNASFEPGGRLEPLRNSDEPLLDLRIRPRLSFYTANDQHASFIIDTTLSHSTGQPMGGAYDPIPRYGSGPEDSLDLSIVILETGTSLAHYTSAPINRTGLEISFTIKGLQPRTESYTVNLTATSTRSKQTFYAACPLNVLAQSSNGGSEVRIDNLYGGLLATVESTGQRDVSIFPYSYYTSWGGFLENSPENVTSFKDQGYNIVHAIPDASLPYGFDFTEFNAFLDLCDEIGLWVMYDMRWSYQNASAVEYQVKQLRDRKSLLLYYTGDEPDGNSDPLNATKTSYDLIKSLDPYHPVSLVLNCYNFYYAEYSAGADIIMEDVYPVAINATYSIQYNTTCNSTYGDCGCDDCEGNFQDISTRLDLLEQYQSWVGGAPKPRWGVPQDFGGSEYWQREPTPEEVAIMSMISLNHGAKGLVAWTYPTGQQIQDETSKLAKILTKEDVVSFFLGANPTALVVAGGEKVDAAAWVLGNQMLVSILNLEYDAVSRNLTIQLPAQSSLSGAALLGTAWEASSNTLTKGGMGPLESDLFMVNLAY